MKSINLKTVIVLIILVLVGVLGVLGMSTVRTYMSGASADTEPKSVTAKPSDDGKSGVVTWVSDKPTMGVVEYGNNPAMMILMNLESEATTDHKVVLSPLKPNTNYFFRIKIGEEIFENGEIPYSFKTKLGDGSVSPTLAVTVAPTAASAGSTGCNKTTDYNKDGKINSLDYLGCVKKGSAVTPTVAGKCQGKIDYDNNGVVNSLDRIKCLQSTP